MIQKKILKEEDYLFERLNSKYNRLWEQLTNIGILIVQIITGYLTAILAIDTSKIPAKVSLIYITFIIILICTALATCVGILEFERTETKKWLRVFVCR